MIDFSLLRLARGRGGRILLASLLSALACLAEIGIFAGVALLLLFALDGSVTYLTGLLTLLISALLTAAFGLVGDLIQNRLGTSIRENLRRESLDKTFRLGGGRAGGLSPSELTQLSTEGIESLDSYFSQYIPSFFSAMAIPFIFLALCLAGNYTIEGADPMLWIFGTVCICIVPLMPLSIAGVSRFAKRVFGKYWNRYLNLGATFADTLKGMVDLKNFDATSRREKLLDDQAEEFRVATMKVLVMQLWSTCIMDIVCYGGAAAGSASAVAIAAQQDTPLSWCLAVFLVLCALRFFLPLRKMGSLFHVAMNGMTAGRKLLDYLDTAEPLWGEKKPEFTGIELRGVSYTYSDSRVTEALKGIDMTFPSRGLYAIAGESGAGKSSLGLILSSQLRPTSGEYLISGIPIKEIDRGWFFSNFLYLSSEPHIFSLSIRDQFRMYDPDITDEKIRESLSEFNLEYLIEEKGLDERLEEKGADLSGGERQRLAMASALAKPRRVIVCDEAMASVDSASEKAIVSALERISTSSLVILITHRMCEIENAESVAAIAGGTIAGQGSFQEISSMGLIPQGGEL